MSKAGSVIGKVGKFGGKLITGAGIVMAGADLAGNIGTANDTTASEEDRKKAKNEAIGGGVGAVLGGIAGSFIPVIGTAIGATLGESLGSTVGEYSGEISDTLEGAGSGLLKAMSPIAKFADDTVDSIGPALRDDVLEPLTVMSKDGVAKVKDVFGNDIVPGIASVFGPLSNFSTTFTDFGKTLEGLGTDILGGAKGLIDKAGKLGKDAGSWVADKAKQAGGAIKQGADVVKRDAGKVWDSGVGFAKNIIGVPPEVAAAAKKAEEKYGVPAAITTAQWQLEKVVVVNICQRVQITHLV